MKNSTWSRSESAASVRSVFSSSTTGCCSWTSSRTSCLIIVAGTDVLFLVYLSTSGPGSFQFAWRPISSVDLPAWTAASSMVTLQEWAVREFRAVWIFIVSILSLGWILARLRTQRTSSTEQSVGKWVVGWETSLECWVRGSSNPDQEKTSSGASILDQATPCSRTQQPEPQTWFLLSCDQLSSARLHRTAPHHSWSVHQAWRGLHRQTWGMRRSYRGSTTRTSELLHACLHDKRTTQVLLLPRSVWG